MNLQDLALRTFIFSGWRDFLAIINLLQDDRKIGLHCVDGNDIMNIRS
jgi:hypothetical protein